MSSREQLVEQLGQLRHEKCLGVWGNAKQAITRQEASETIALEQKIQRCRDLRLFASERGDRCFQEPLRHCPHLGRFQKQVFSVDCEHGCQSC